MKKYYYDIEVLEEEFCILSDCTACHGMDPSGEPNGYGCESRDHWVEEKIDSGEWGEVDPRFSYYRSDDADREIRYLSLQVYTALKALVSITETREIMQEMLNDIDAKDTGLGHAALRDVHRVAKKAIETIKLQEKTFNNKNN